MKENARARGQTLVLMGLTMLLLVVMVCLTLAIGMRAREKMELQTLADATAYSNAVATARVFNTISVWSRAQVSHMVVLAGAQSHISYSGWYLGALRSSAIAAGASAIACTAACANPVGACNCPTCVNVGKIAQAFNNEYDDRLNAFKSLDRLAGIEGRLLQSQAAAYGLAQKALAVQHGIWIGQGGFADQFLELAVPDSEMRHEYSTSMIANTASLAEIANPIDSIGGGGALMPPGQSRGPYPALPAAHGARKSDFIRNRSVLIPPWRPVTIYLQNQGIGGYFSASGAGYFGTGKHDTNERDAKEAWADDEGWQTGGLVFGGCALWAVPPSPAFGQVQSTHSAESSDDHTWTTGSPHDGNASDTHSMGSCGSSCPSVWVLRQEYNLNPDDVEEGDAYKNQWRQPKNLVALQRDYDQRSFKDPWNLMFNYRLASGDSGGSGPKVDIGKKEGGTELKKQLAIATAITYYHRHMEQVSYAWQEPPNLFNPFWRATLVPVDIDQSGTLEAGAVSGASSTSFAAALAALKAAGFTGIQ